MTLVATLDLRTGTVKVPNGMRLDLAYVKCVAWVFGRAMLGIDSRNNETFRSARTAARERQHPSCAPAAVLRRRELRNTRAAAGTR